MVKSQDPFALEYPLANPVSALSLARRLSPAFLFAALPSGVC